MVVRDTGGRVLYEGTAENVTIPEHEVWNLPSDDLVISVTREGIEANQVVSLDPGGIGGQGATESITWNGKRGEFDARGGGMTQIDAPTLTIPLVGETPKPSGSVNLAELGTQAAPSGMPEFVTIVDSKGNTLFEGDIPRSGYVPVTVPEDGKLVTSGVSG